MFMRTAQAVHRGVLPRNQTPQAQNLARVHATYTARAVAVPCIAQSGAVQAVQGERVRAFLDNSCITANIPPTSGAKVVERVTTPQGVKARTAKQSRAVLVYSTARAQSDFANIGQALAGCRGLQGVNLAKQYTMGAKRVNGMNACSWARSGASRTACTPCQSAGVQPQRKYPPNMAGGLTADMCHMGVLCQPRFAIGGATMCTTAGVTALQNRQTKNHARSTALTISHRGQVYACPLCTVQKAFRGYWARGVYYRSALIINP